MQRKNAENKPASIPAPPSTPRDVRLNASGVIMAIAAATLVIGGIWAGTELYTRVHRPSLWPVFVVPLACTSGAFMMVYAMGRQRHLLTYGRATAATVTKVEKKRTDKGTYWRVHYEWRLLSGAKRKGHYRHNRKEPPAMGATISIVYDPDQPEKKGRYPFSFVTIRGK